jgi:hypothetical protein
MEEDLSMQLSPTAKALQTQKVDFSTVDMNLMIHNNELDNTKSSNRKITPRATLKSF